jgi:hypothetical protein
VSSPSGAHDQIFITLWQLRYCFCRAPSLTRGRICLLYMLLALASAFILGSKSRGTRDQILLSQIQDFPFCRFLFHYCAFSRFRGNNIFTELFPSNGSYTVACLHSSYLAMGLHVTICRSILRKQVRRVCTVQICLRISISGRLLWTRWWTFGFHKTRGICWPGQQWLDLKKNPPVCSLLEKEMGPWCE